MKNTNMFTESFKDERLTQKWMRTGLLENLEKNKAQKIARLLENTAVWLLSLDKSVAEKLTPISLPIVRRVFDQIDFDVVAMPAYLDSDGAARIVEFYPICNITLPSDLDLTGTVDAEVEVCHETSQKLERFLQEKVDSGYKIVAYTPFVYGPPCGSDIERLISFRGNFILQNK